MEAHNLRQIDEDYRVHQEAWLSFAAQAKKKSGMNKEVPVYKKFRDFYDYEKEIDKYLRPKVNQLQGLSRYMKEKELETK